MSETLDVSAPELASEIVSGIRLQELREKEHRLAQMEGNHFMLARSVMVKVFRDEPQPGGIRDAYIANLAMLIYDDQNKDAQECRKFGLDDPLDLSNLVDCNTMAERILKLLFE